MIELFVKQASPKFKMEHVEMFSEVWFKPEEASAKRKNIQPLVEEELKRYTTDPASKRKRNRKQKTASEANDQSWKTASEANDQSPATSNDHSIEPRVEVMSENVPLESPRNDQPPASSNVRPEPRVESELETASKLISENSPSRQLANVPISDNNDFVALFNADRTPLYPVNDIHHTSDSDKPLASDDEMHPEKDDENVPISNLLQEQKDCLKRRKHHKDDDEVHPEKREEGELDEQKREEQPQKRVIKRKRRDLPTPKTYLSRNQRASRRPLDRFTFDETKRRETRNYDDEVHPEKREEQPQK